MSTHYAYPLSFGAQLVTPELTRFRLWAPSAQTVTLAISNGPSVPMTPTTIREAGWFEVEVNCGAGTEYQYQVLEKGTAADVSAATTPATLSVPDPASRLQAADVHGASVVLDPLAFAWQHDSWRGRPWHETVLYELHVGACGGYEGVKQKLPQLAALGITAIELMPLADFPGAHNWGYDGVLPFAPDTAYGTPDQLKQLIDSAHGLGIMVFLDVVYNHFGPDGNYLGSYAAPFFRDDISTLWGQSIDFRQPVVRDFFTENALYWLMEYRFDGLRFDAVHAISEQDWLHEMAERVRAAVEPDRHVHLVLENDDNVAQLLGGPEQRRFDAQWNDDCHHALHVMLTNEAGGYYADYADAPAEQLARALAEGFIYQGQPSSHRQGGPRGEPSGHLPPTSFVMFLQNHDQIGNRAFGERLTQLADPRALRAASALLLLAPHIPLLFMGDEFGSTRPFLYFTSHTDPALADAVREGRRQEFAKFPAFADSEQRARIPDPNAVQTFDMSIPDSPTAELDLATQDHTAGGNGNADMADHTPAGWLACTRRLLAVRHAQIVPRLVGAQSLGASAIGPKAVAARWQMGDGRVLAMALNLDATPVAVSLDQLSQPAGADLLWETSGALAALATGALPPYSFTAWMEAAA